MALALGETRNITALVLDWKCDHCGRYLARVVGARFETPSGVVGHLPGSIRCPNCKRSAAWSPPVDVPHRAG